MDSDLLLRRLSMTMLVLAVSLVAACQSPGSVAKRDTTPAQATTSSPSGY